MLALGYQPGDTFSQTNNPRSCPRYLGGISEVPEISRRSNTKGVFVYGRSRINLDDGGKGYLPWISDGPSSSGQGVPVLGPSLPSPLGLGNRAADELKTFFM